MILYWGDIWNVDRNLSENRIYKIAIIGFKVLNMVIQLAAQILFLFSFNFLTKIKIKELASQKKGLKLKNKLVIIWVWLLILMVATT